jgi:hypothetical protein
MSQLAELLKQKLLTIAVAMLSNGIALTRDTKAKTHSTHGFVLLYFFSLDNYFICNHQIYGFCLPIWHLQTFPTNYMYIELKEE